MSPGSSNPSVSVVTNASYLSSLYFSFPACKQASDKFTHEYHPVTRLRSEDLASILRETNAVLASTPEETPDLSTKLRQRIEDLVSRAEARIPKIPIISDGSKSEFLALWARSLPVIVQQVELTSIWSVEYLSTTYGKEQVDVVGNMFDDDEEAPETFAELLQLWALTSDRQRTIDLRVSLRISLSKLTADETLEFFAGLATQRKLGWTALGSKRTFPRLGSHGF